MNDFDANELFELYRRGLYIQVKERGEVHAPIREWPGPEGQKLAARLTTVLGAPRLGMAIAVRFLRRCPNEPAALLERAGDLLHLDRALEAMELLDAAHTARWASASDRCEAEILRALSCSHFRDFERAHAHLREALAIGEPPPFHFIARSVVLRGEDRYDEALDAVRELLERLPFYGPAVLHTADLLTLRRAHDEAIALLRYVLANTENGHVALHLARNLTLLDRHAEALDALERYEQLSPLLEPQARKALASQRSDRAYDLGDRERAIAWARESSSPYYETIAGALEAAPRDAVRRELQVDFVRQHHMTCVPATLSMLAHYFDRPAEHLSIAEEICYGGTTSYAERQWALEHGFHAREFRVTWEGAKQLVDRSLPFTVTTVHVTSGHLQAIVGYDEARGTLLVRDPYHPDDHEALASKFLEAFAASGPRGMVLVPVERRDELDALALSDAELYDQLFAIEGALKRHDREQAYELYVRLREEAPDEPCTIRGRYALSAYDRDAIGLLSCLERLLERWPDDAMLQFQKMQALSALGRDLEVRAFLVESCAKSRPLPAFQRELARLDASDPSRRRESRRLLRKALRHGSREARGYQLLAWLDHDEGNRSRSVTLRRIASTLEDTREDLALDYFHAVRDLGRVGEGMAFLEARFEKALGRSGGPAESLVAVLVQRMEGERALAVIERSIAARPEDGEHLVALAGWLANLGHVERARELLERARPNASRVTVARQEARLAWMHADFSGALACWRIVLEVDPLDVTANERVAELLELTEGQVAALEHFQSVVEEFPFHGLLLRAAARFFGDREPQRALDLLERLQEDRPFDAWLHRERALRLIDLRRVEESLEAASTAKTLEPEESASHHIHGLALLRAGKHDEARAILREALVKDAESFALLDLVGPSFPPARHREDLEFAVERLVAQPGKTDGIVHVGQRARQVLDLDQADAFLVRLTERFPEAWPAWMELLSHRLFARGAPEGTLEEAERCVERFPDVAPLWRLAGELRGRAGDLEGRRTALERACSLRPDWSTPFLQLAELHEREGDFEASRAILERVVVQDPGSARNHAWLADALFALEEHERALEHVRIALTFQPDDELAWDLLRRLERALDREDLVVNMARTVAQRRPGSSLSWKVLARRLGEHPTERFDERRRALQRAQQLAPDDFEAFDLEVELLFEAGSWTEAETLWREGAARFGDRLEYRVRGTWFPWIQGKRAAALKSLREILEENPDHVPGFELLANWLEALGDHTGYLEAMREFAALATNGETLARLAHAALMVGEYVEADRALERAIALAPWNVWVGERLIDHVLDGRWEGASGRLEEVKEAERRLDLVRRHQAGWHVDRLALRIALHAERFDEAAKQLEDLLLAKDRTIEEAREAIAFFHDHRSGGHADRLLTALVKREGVPAFLGTLWIESIASRGAFRSARSRLKRLPVGSAVHARACGRLIGLLAGANQKGAARQLIRRHASHLRRDEVAILDVADALTSMREYAQVLSWLDPAESGKGRLPFVALLRANALRGLGRWEEARAAAAEGVTYPSDSITSWLRLWLAAHHLLEGDVVAARGQIGSVSKPELNAYHGYLLENLLATSEMLTCEPVHKRSLAIELEARLRQAAKEYPSHRRQGTLRTMTLALAHVREFRGSRTSFPRRLAQKRAFARVTRGG